MMASQDVDDDVLLMESSPFPVVDLISDDSDDDGSRASRHQEHTSSAAVAAAASGTRKAHTAHTSPANRTSLPSPQQLRPTSQPQSAEQNAGCLRRTVRKQITTLLLLDSDSDYSDVEWCDGAEPAASLEGPKDPKEDGAESEAPSEGSKDPGEESCGSAQSSTVEPEICTHERQMSCAGYGQTVDSAEMEEESTVSDLRKEAETPREEQVEEAEKVVNVVVHMDEDSRDISFEYPPHEEHQSTSSDDAIPIMDKEAMERDRSFSFPVSSGCFASKENREKKGNVESVEEEFDFEMDPKETGKQKQLTVCASSAQAHDLGCGFEGSSSLDMKNGKDEFALDTEEGKTDADTVTDLCIVYAPHSQAHEGRESNLCGQKRKSMNTFPCDSGPVFPKHPKMAPEHAQQAGLWSLLGMDPDQSDNSRADIEPRQKIPPRKSPGCCPSQHHPQNTQQVARQLNQPLRPVLLIKSSQGGITFSTSFDSFKASGSEGTDLAFSKEAGNSVQNEEQGSGSGVQSVEGSRNCLQEKAETLRCPGPVLDPSSTPLPPHPYPSTTHSLLTSPSTTHSLLTTPSTKHSLLTPPSTTHSLLTSPSVLRSKLNVANTLCSRSTRPISTCQVLIPRPTTNSVHPPPIVKHSQLTPPSTTHSPLTPPSTTRSALTPPSTTHSPLTTPCSPCSLLTDPCSTPSQLTSDKPQTEEPYTLPSSDKEDDLFLAPELSESEATVKLSAVDSKQPCRTRHRSSELSSQTPGPSSTLPYSAFRWDGDGHDDGDDKDPSTECQTAQPDCSRGHDTSSAVKHTSGALHSLPCKPLQWSDDENDDENHPSGLQAVAAEKQKDDHTCFPQAESASENLDKRREAQDLSAGAVSRTQSVSQIFFKYFMSFQDASFLSHLRKLQPLGALLTFLLKAQDEKVFVCGHCVEVGTKDLFLKWGKTSLNISCVQGVLVVQLAELIRHNIVMHKMLLHYLLRRRQFPAVWSLIETDTTVSVKAISLVYLLLILEDMLNSQKLNRSSMGRIRLLLNSPMVLTGSVDCFCGLDTIYRKPSYICSSVLSRMAQLKWTNPMQDKDDLDNMGAERITQSEDHYIDMKGMINNPTFLNHPFMSSLQRMYSLCPCGHLSLLDEEERQLWRKVEVEESISVRKLRIDSLGLIRFMGHNIFCFLSPIAVHISVFELEHRGLLPSNYFKLLVPQFMLKLQASSDVRCLKSSERAFLKQFFSHSSGGRKQSFESMLFTPHALHLVYEQLSQQLYKYKKHAKAIYYMMTLGHHCSWSLQVTPPTTQLHHVPGYPHPDEEEQPAAMIISQNHSSRDQDEVSQRAHYDGGGGTPPAVKLVEDSLNDCLEHIIYLFGLKDIAEPFCQCRIQATQLHKYRFLEFDGVELNHVTQMVFAGQVLHCWRRREGLFVSLSELQWKGLSTRSCQHSTSDLMLDCELVFLSVIPSSPLCRRSQKMLINIFDLHQRYKQYNPRLAGHKFRIKLWKHSCPWEDSDGGDVNSVQTVGPAAELSTSTVDDGLKVEDVMDLTEESGPDTAALSPPLDLLESRRRSAPSPASSIVDLVDCDSSDVSLGEEDEVNVESVDDAPPLARQGCSAERRLFTPSCSGAGPPDVPASCENLDSSSPPPPPPPPTMDLSLTASCSDRGEPIPSVSSPVQEQLPSLDHSPMNLGCSEQESSRGSAGRQGDLIVSRVEGQLTVGEVVTILTKPSSSSGEKSCAVNIQFHKACLCPDRKVGAFPIYSFLQCLYSPQSPFTILEQLGQAVVCGKLVFCVYRLDNIFFSFLDLSRAGIIKCNSLEDFTRQVSNLKPSPSSEDTQNLRPCELEAISNLVTPSLGDDSVQPTPKLLVSPEVLRLLLLQEKKDEHGGKLIHLHKIGHICPQTNSTVHRVQRRNPSMNRVQSSWMSAFRWCQDLGQQLAARRAGCSAGCTLLTRTERSARDNSSSADERACGDCMVFVRSVDDRDSKVRSPPAAEEASQYVSLTPLQWGKILSAQTLLHEEKQTPHITSGSVSQDSRNSQEECLVSPAKDSQVSGRNAVIPKPEIEDVRVKQKMLSVKEEPGCSGSGLNPATGSDMSTGSTVSAESVIPPAEAKAVKREPGLSVPETELVLRCNCGEDHEEEKFNPCGLSSVDTKTWVKAISPDSVHIPHDHSRSETELAHPCCCHGSASLEQRKPHGTSVSSLDTCRTEKDLHHGCVSIDYSHSPLHHTCEVHTNIPRVSGNVIRCEAQDVEKVLESYLVEGVVVDPVSRQIKVVQDEKKILQLMGKETRFLHLVLMGILKVEGGRYMCLGMEGRLYVNWGEAVQDLPPQDRTLLFKQAQALHGYLYLPPSFVHQRLSRWFGCDVCVLQSAPWVCINTLVAIYNMGSGLLPREKILKRFVDITPDSFFFPFFLLFGKRKKSMGCKEVYIYTKT